VVLALADSASERAPRGDARRTRRLIVGVAAAVVVVAAIVVTVTSLTTSTSPKSRLAARLLAAADLPASWHPSATTSTSEGLAQNRCLAGATGSSSNATHATVTFVEGSGLPFLSDTLVDVSSPRQRLAAITRSLDACTSLTFRQGSATIRGRLAPLALSRAGPASAAYALTFSTSGIHVTADLVFFASRSAIGDLVYGDSATPPASAVLAFASAAAARANGASPIVHAVSIVSVPVRVAHTADGSVGYREFGRGPALVLVMGYAGTMESWDPRLVDALAQRFRVVIFDNAGVGATSALAAPLTIDAMADQTSALIDALGLHRVDVLGWSMGGTIAQALAVLHPEQVAGLVLCATFPGDGHVVRPAQSDINALTNGDSAGAIADLFPADQSGAYGAFAAALGDYPSATPAPASVIAAQRTAVIGWWTSTDPASSRTSSIAAPTLVADGANDRLDPVVNDHILASLIPGAHLVLYRDAGHAFLSQDQAAFVPLLDSFLR